jgi:hypothetical protein
MASQGGALIMVVVDEFVGPSEVAMESINMWVRFYNLLKVSFCAYWRSMASQGGCPNHGCSG